MKRLYILTVILIASVAALTSIPSYRVSSTSFRDNAYDLVDYPLVAFSDLVVSIDGTRYELVSFKRDSLGYYNFVDSRAISDSSFILDLSLSTDEEWIFVSNLQYSVTSRQIFRIDSNGYFGNQTYQVDASQSSWMFDDGSVVSFDVDTIRTFRFNGTDWAVSSTESLNDYPTGDWTRIGPNYVFTTTQITADPEVYAVVIFARQPDGSWALNETIPLSYEVLGGYVNVLYDGNDTILTATGTGYGTDGRIIVYSRKNNWVPIQNITLDTVGIVEYDDGVNIIGSFFGQRIQFVDQNTVVVTAPHSGYTNNTSFLGGSITWLERDTSSNLWTPTKQATSSRAVTFGLGLEIVGKQVITLEAESSIIIDGNDYFGNTTLYLTGAAPCTLETADVTCHNLTWPSCDTLPESSNQLNVSSLYTVKTSIGCGNVSVQASGVSKDAQSVNVELTFTLPSVNQVTCTSVISCTPSAPVTSQQPTGAPRPTKVSVSSRSTGMTALTLIAAFVVLLH